MSKYKLVVSEYYPIIAALLVFGVLLGGFLTFRAFRTEYETVREEDFLTSYEGSYRNVATVVEDNPLWREGETLEDRSSYLIDVTPVLDTRFELEFLRPPDDGEVTLRSGLLATLEVGGETYWQDFVEKDSVEADFPGREFATDFEVSPEEIEELENEIRESLGAEVGTLDVKVVTEVEFDGEIGGEDIGTAEEAEMSVESGGDVYSVDAESFDRRVTSTSYVDVPVEVPILDKALPLLLIVLSLSVLGIVTYQWRSVDEEKVKAFKAAGKRSKFEEWISEGEVPALNFDEEIRIDSLEDLIDLAVDLGERVIHDGAKSTYYVLHEDILYTYGEPGRKDGVNLLDDDN